MAQMQVMQAGYQVVRFNIPRQESQLNNIELVNTFQAPPGFRLHSWQILKDSQLIGQHHQVLAVFESVMAGMVDVPDGDETLLNGTPVGSA